MRFGKGLASDGIGIERRSKSVFDGRHAVEGLEKKSERVVKAAAAAAAAALSH